MKAAIPMLGAALVLADCTAPTRNLYEGADVGRVIETYEGTVVSSRPIDIADAPRDLSVGPLAGAAAGTGIGLNIGEGEGNALATILGALIGAGAGYLAERSARDRQGIEYVIRTGDGRTVTVVQNRDIAEAPIPAGTPVLLQYGGAYTRVIEKPQDLDRPDASRWADPDRPGSPGVGTPGLGDSGTGTPGLPDPGAGQSGPSN